MIMSIKQRKIKIGPRIKSNDNIHLYVRSFVRSFVCSFVHSFVRSINHSFTQSFIHLEPNLSKLHLNYTHKNYYIFNFNCTAFNCALKTIYVCFINMFCDWLKE